MSTEHSRTAKGSDSLREALGDHVFTSLLATKTIEQGDERRHITGYEINRYLPTQ